MTPTPNLQAAAMRARAADVCDRFAATCKHCAATPHSHPENVALDNNRAVAAEYLSAAILALPLESDHAALLAEALAVVKAAGFVVYEYLPDFSKMDEQELNYWRAKMNAWGGDMRHEQADAVKRISAALLALETP